MNADLLKNTPNKGLYDLKQRINELIHMSRGQTVKNDAAKELQQLQENGIMMCENGDIMISPISPKYEQPVESNCEKRNKPEDLQRVVNYTYNINVNIDNSVHTTHIIHADHSYHKHTNIGIGTDIIGTAMNNIAKLGGQIDKLFGL